MWYDLFELVSYCCLLAIASEAIAEILTASKLFGGLRTSLGKLAICPIIPSLATINLGSYCRLKLFWFLNAVFSCGYCMSVWTAVLVSWCAPGEYFGLLPNNNILIKIFIIHRFSNVFHTTIELYRLGRIVPQDITLTVRIQDDQSPMNHGAQ